MERIPTGDWSRVDTRSITRPAPAASTVRRQGEAIDIFDRDSAGATPAQAGRPLMPTLHGLNTRGHSGRAFASVTEELLIGQRHCLRHWGMLREVGITNILNVTLEPPARCEFGLVCETIAAKDTLEQRLAPYFEAVAQRAREVQRRGGRLLIVCQEGISRSATLVLATLMINHRMPLSDAFAHLADCWGRVEPNTTFLKELRRLELQIFRTPSPVGLTPLDTLALASEGDMVERVRVLLSRSATDFPKNGPDDQEIAFFSRDLAASPGADEAAIVHQLIFVCLESFASVSPRDEAARRTLRRLLAGYLDGCGLNRAEIEAILQQQRASEQWREFCIDVPFATKFMPTADELVAEGTYGGHLSE